MKVGKDLAGKMLVEVSNAIDENGASYEIDDIKATEIHVGQHEIEMLFSALILSLCRGQ